MTEATNTAESERLRALADRMTDADNGGLDQG